MSFLLRKEDWEEEAESFDRFILFIRNLEVLRMSCDYTKSL